MPGCCAKNCSNRWEKGFKMFRVPSGRTDQNRREAWLANINRRNFKATKNSALCEVRFFKYSPKHDKICPVVHLE